MFPWKEPKERIPLAVRARSHRSCGHTEYQQFGPTAWPPSRIGAGSGTIRSGRSADQGVHAPVEQPARVCLVVHCPDLHAKPGAVGVGDETGRDDTGRPRRSGTDSRRTVDASRATAATNDRAPGALLRVRRLWRATVPRAGRRDHRPFGIRPRRRAPPLARCAVPRPPAAERRFVHLDLNDHAYVAADRSTCESSGTPAREARPPFDAIRPVRATTSCDPASHRDERPHVRPGTRAHRAPCRRRRAPRRSRRPPACSRGPARLRRDARRRAA